MSKSWVIRVSAALVVLSLAGFGGWLFSLPSATGSAEAPAVSSEEADAMLAALKPPKRERPLIAVIGINDATETTDYLMPVGILRRADVADVMMLATGPGPVQLYPALKVEPDATIAEFDVGHPQGADYVIVPAMEPHDDPAALAWIRSQAEKGATIVSVCVGATVVGAARCSTTGERRHTGISSSNCATRPPRSGTSPTEDWWSTAQSRRRPASAHPCR